MPTSSDRARWVSYLRISTAEQAERALSITAQRHAVSEFAAGHGAVIDHEYVEPGASGTDPHRPILNRLLSDALQPGSAIGTIVVHHTSRFTRDATHARIVKSKLRRAGVRVLSALQEIADDPMGTLMEGLFECIDQYESELNGLRTSAAMREAVRQGFYPGARPPYGYRSVPVEVRPDVVRHRLENEPSEAETVREIYRLYITESGAKAAARTLNQRGCRTRSGALWDKGKVMQLLDQTAASGSVRWGRRHHGASRAPGEWLTLSVEPIVDAKTHALAQQLRVRREPRHNPGRTAAKPHVLSDLVWCGKCGASYQLETSGKRVDGTVYRYCYYNCRAACRAGMEACSGFRIATDVLDTAVRAALAEVVCTSERARGLVESFGWPAERVLEAWRALLTCDSEVGRTYALHLIERVEVHGERVLVVPKACGRNEETSLLDVASE
jgi:site-specific DNA recombinase